jgi:hypothetical protein
MPRVKSDEPKKRAVSVVERRLKSGAIFSASSRPIPLTDPDRWTVRVVNTHISDNRVWEMQADKGWVYATADDVAVPVTELGFREQDGRIVRGQHGAEVLMKMEREDYAAIQKAKEDANRKMTFGSKAVKDSILAAAGNAEGVGAEGAEYLSRNLHNVSVTDSREAVSLED